MKHLIWLAAGMASTALWAAEIPPANLVYYSNFDTDNSILAQLPKEQPGAWNTGNDGDVGATAFETVAGADRALLPSFGRHTTGQQMLSAADRAWTIAFRARTGTVPCGILFAFGTHNSPAHGGLAFRRGATPGSLEVTLSADTEHPLFSWAPEATDRTEDALFHAVALTCDLDDGETGSMELFVDGVSRGKQAIPSDAVIIDNAFQWGKRHANAFPGEADGANNAISWMGVWKRVLTPEEIAGADTPVQRQLSDVSFHLPTDRMDLTAAIPNQAIRLTVDQAPIRLENVPGAWQTRADGTAVNVADIVGDSGSRQNLFGVHDTTCGRTATIDRDVWLKISGGSHGVIVGGTETGWRSNQALWPRGTLVTELGPEASADHIIGVIHKSGDGDIGIRPSFAGTSMVVVDGLVRGAVIGGATSHDDYSSEISGVVGVTVRSVQTSEEKPTGSRLTSYVGDYVVGGSAYEGNTGKSVFHSLGEGMTQDTVLTYADILLPPDARGIFDRTICGGTYASGGNGDWQIQGSTAVRISAPESVIFSHPIYGASLMRSKYAKVGHVLGNSSVTIEGGTFSCPVVAGGYAVKAGQTYVYGTASLILKGGVFTEKACLCKRMNEANNKGASSLQILGPVDFTAGPTVVPEFGTTVIGPDGVLKLGTWRGLQVPLTTVEGKIALTLSQEEIALGALTLAFAPGSDAFAAEHLAISNLPNGWTVTGDGAKGFVIAPEGTQTWAERFPDFVTGDSLTVSGHFTAAVTSPVETGDLTFGKGADVNLSLSRPMQAASLTVEADAALTTAFGPDRLNPAALTVRGSLCAYGTVDSPTVFEAGSVLKMVKGRALELTGTVEGPVTLCLPDTADPSVGFVLPALKTANDQLTVSIPEGTGCRLFYRDGTYWVTNLPTPGSETFYVTEIREQDKVLPLSSLIVMLGGIREKLPLPIGEWALLPPEEHRLTLTYYYNTELSLDFPLTNVDLTVRGRESTLSFIGNSKLSLSGLNLIRGTTLNTPYDLMNVPDNAVIDGTLTYVMPSGNGTILPPTLKGNGTVVKAGGGTMQLKTVSGKIWGTPNLTVTGGKLQIQDNAAPGQVSGNITLTRSTSMYFHGWDSGLRLDKNVSLTFEGGSRMDMANGRGYSNSSRICGEGRICINAPDDSVTFTGVRNGDRFRIDTPISGEGTLILSAGYKATGWWTVEKPISDADTAQGKILAVRISKYGSAVPKICLKSDNTFTGGLTVDEGITTFHIENGACAGCGDVTVATGAQILLKDKATVPITIAPGHTLTLQGTVAPYLQAQPVRIPLAFADGAVLDVTRGLSAPIATTETSFGGRWIVKALDEQIEAGLQLTAGTAAPTETEVLGQDAKGTVEFRDDGLWLAPVTAPEPEAPSVVLPEGADAAPETVAAVTKALTEQLADAAASVKTVNIVPGTNSKGTLSVADAENALAVFGSSAAVVTLSEDGLTATATVSCELVICDIALDPAGATVTFTAKATCGEKAAILAEGAKIRIFRNDAEVENQTKSTLTDGEARFTVPMEAGAPLYKVEAFR